MAASLASRLRSRASARVASISAVTSRNVLASTSPRSFMRSASFCSCRWCISSVISLIRVIVIVKKTLKPVADYTTEIMNALDKKPAVVWHSTGGLLAQMLAGRGFSAATVAIDPGVFRGVLPLPVLALEAAGLSLVNPFTRRRAITLTFDHFKYGRQTRWRRRKRRSSTIRSTSPAPGFLLCRLATRTATRGRRR